MPKDIPPETPISFQKAVLPPRNALCFKDYALIWSGTAMVGGIATLAVGTGADLFRRLHSPRRTESEKLALLKAKTLDVRSANLMALAATLPSNLTTFIDGQKPSLDSHVSARMPDLHGAELTHRRIVTNLGISSGGLAADIHYHGHERPVCRHVRRVGPDRLGRVLLELSPDLYYAVSTGIWDATVNPSVDDKKSPTSAQEPEPQRALVFHQRHKIHRQVGPVLHAHA